MIEEPKFDIDKYTQYVEDTPLLMVKENTPSELFDDVEEFVFDYNEQVLMMRQVKEGESK